MLPAAAMRALRLVGCICTFALVFVAVPALRAQNGQAVAPQAAAGAVPNYDLAAQWTTQKVNRLVFDTSVTPRWLDTGDRFWYAYQTREGRRFFLVDPVKKAKVPLFDHARMAAALTTITRIPYDAQNLPFSTVRFVKKDTAFEFNFQVPATAVIPSTKPRETTTEQAQQGATKGGDEDESLDPPQGVQTQTGRQGGRGARGAGRGDAPAPPRNKTLYFEYDLATAKVTLLEDHKPDPRPLRWASFSPDNKTVLFARNHNLFMMDAENYAKALKDPNDKTIVEVQLTTDGEDFYGYSARSGGRGNQDDQQQQQQQQQEDEQQQEQREDVDAKNARVTAVAVQWSRDSGKFTLVRRDVRKVKDLWVINPLANPRPTLETYRYAMPGEENTPQAEIFVFDVKSKGRVKVKADRFQDQTVSIATKPQRPVAGAGRGGGGGAGGPQTPPRPQEWLHDGADKIYFTRLSRDMHRLDVCVADTATGDVRPVIEERLNTYIESKPLRLAGNGSELIFWSERDGWGHFYLYDAATGALKNRITEGEFVTTSLESVDDKARVVFLTAAGREKGEDSVLHAPLQGRSRRHRHEAPGPGRRVAFGHRVRIEPVLRHQLVPRRQRARVHPLRHAGERRHQARDAGSDRAQGHGLQVPRALHRQGR